MSCLHYQQDELYIENVSLQTVAEQFGTPCYVYSKAAIEKNWRSFDQAFQAIPHHICYAVKANSNIAILRLLARLGSGFDIVSAGELKRVIEAGGDPSKTVFSGVGKSAIEIEFAIQNGIYCFDIESEPELMRINAIASKLNATINVALRVNPDVNPNTHAHISTGLKENKFGIEMSDVIPLCQKIKSMRSLSLIGIACHIGSQITDLQPFLLAIDSLIDLHQQLKQQDILIKHLNIGGGLGITYRDEKPPAITQYASTIQEKLNGHALELIIEPGRAIIGNAGVLLTRVEYLKHTQHKNFAIVDAGMNDLIRFALYEAWQNILPLKKRHHEKKLYDIAGPVCESSDFLGKNRELALEANDLLAVDSAGAYGFSMSSNYNTRYRPAEVMIDDTTMHLIRRRETMEDLLATEMEITSEL
jgi:diaminopimelate decarboxylase